jgi:hypothetical protein
VDFIKWLSYVINEQNFLLNLIVSDYKTGTPSLLLLSLKLAFQKEAGLKLFPSRSEIWKFLIHLLSFLVQILVFAFTFMIPTNTLLSLLFI